MDSWGVKVPRFEGTAALPMEREGKAAEGLGGSGSCWLLCVVLCCVLWV
jgi:hypothetical protein